MYVCGNGYNVWSFVQIKQRQITSHTVSNRNRFRFSTYFDHDYWNPMKFYWLLFDFLLLNHYHLDCIWIPMRWCFFFPPSKFRWNQTNYSHFSWISILPLCTFSSNIYIALTFPTGTVQFLLFSPQFLFFSAWYGIDCIFGSMKMVFFKLIDSLTGVDHFLLIGPFDSKHFDFVSAGWFCWMCTGLERTY